MEDRLYAFLPSMIIIGGIGITAFLYTHWSLWRLRPYLKSLAWQEANRKKITLHIGTPLINIAAPMLEEVIFRTPLLIFYGSMTEAGAWSAVVLLSIPFGALHWFGKHVSIQEVLADREKGLVETDDAKAEIRKYYYRHHGEKRMLKALHVVVTIGMGILFGYLAVTYQSLWVAVIAHAAWNLLFPLTVMILMIVLVLIYSVFAGIGKVLFNRIFCRA